MPYLLRNASSELLAAFDPIKDCSDSENNQSNKLIKRICVIASLIKDNCKIATSWAERQSTYSEFPKLKFFLLTCCLTELKELQTQLRAKMLDTSALQSDHQDRESFSHGAEALAHIVKVLDNLSNNKKASSPTLFDQPKPEDCGPTGTASIWVEHWHREKSKKNAEIKTERRHP